MKLILIKLKKIGLKWQGTLKLLENKEKNFFLHVQSITDTI